MTTTEIDPVVSSTLGFANTVRSVVTVSESSVQILKKVERTVSALESRRDVFASLAQVGRGLAGTLERQTFKGAFDPNNVMIEALETTQIVLRGAISQFIQREASVDADKRLKADWKAYLHGAFNVEAVGAMGELDAALDDMRHAIICHDLEFDRPVSASYDDAASLIAALRASH